jgi:hypothetical protein
MSLQRKHIYEFGPFRLDAAEHLLLRDGEAAHTQSLRPVAGAGRAARTQVKIEGRDSLGH